MVVAAALGFILLAVPPQVRAPIRDETWEGHGDTEAADGFQSFDRMRITRSAAGTVVVMMSNGDKIRFEGTTTDPFETKAFKFTVSKVKERGQPPVIDGHTVCEVRYNSKGNPVEVRCDASGGFEFFEKDYFDPGCAALDEDEPKPHHRHR